MDDKQIIDLYMERSESAISETEKKYGRYCRYISHKILNNESDAEEIVNDTYYKVWDTIPPNHPDSLKSYLGMIARQLSLNRYDQSHAKKRLSQTAMVIEELYECVPDEENAGTITEKIILKDVLNNFIGSLPELTQRVFVRRYWYAASIAEIAEEYSMKESSVTVLLLRTRKKLKKHLFKEGFET
jgi:RNA polymerase sigma-70 factor (ECF subfamily)